LPQTNLRLAPLQAVFAVDRLISPVGRAYRELVAEWKNILPAQSFSLGPCRVDKIARKLGLELN
jgi:hypothetical protein